MPEENKVKLRGQIIYTTATGELRTIVTADQEGKIGGIDGEVDLARFSPRYNANDGTQYDDGAADAMSSLVDEQLLSLRDPDSGLSDINRAKTITKVAKLGNDDNATQVFQVNLGRLTKPQEDALLAKLGGALLDKAIIRQGLDGAGVSELDTQTAPGVLYGTRFHQKITAGEISPVPSDALKKAYADQAELMTHLRNSKGEEYQPFTEEADGKLAPSAGSTPARTLRPSLADGIASLRHDGKEIDRCLEAVGIDNPDLQSKAHSVDAIGSVEMLRRQAGMSYSTIANTVADRQAKRETELNEIFDDSKRDNAAYGRVLADYRESMRRDSGIDPGSDLKAFPKEHIRQIQQAYLAEKRVVEYEKQCKVRAQRGDLETFLRANKLVTSNGDLITPDKFREMVQKFERDKDAFLKDQKDHLPPDHAPGREPSDYDEQKRKVEQWVKDESLRQFQLAANEQMEVNDQHVFRRKKATEPFLDMLVKKTGKSSVSGALTLAARLPGNESEEDSIFDFLNIGAMAKTVLNAYAETLSWFKKSGAYSLNKDSTPADVTAYRVVTDPKFARSIVEGVEGCIVTNPDGKQELDLSGLSQTMQKDMREKNSKSMEFLVGMIGFAKATYGTEAKLPDELPDDLKKQLQDEGNKYADRLARSRAKLEKDRDFKPVDRVAQGKTEKLDGTSVRTSPSGTGPSMRSAAEPKVVAPPSSASSSASSAVSLVVSPPVGGGGPPSGGGGPSPGSGGPGRT